MPTKLKNGWNKLPKDTLDIPVKPIDGPPSYLAAEIVNGESMPVYCVDDVVVLGIVGVLEYDLGKWLLGKRYVLSDDLVKPGLCPFFFLLLRGCEYYITEGLALWSVSPIGAEWITNEAPNITTVGGHSRTLAVYDCYWGMAPATLATINSAIEQWTQGQS